MIRTIDGIDVRQEGCVFSIYANSCTLLYETVRNPPKKEKYCIRLDVFIQKYYGSDREELYAIVSKVEKIIKENKFCSPSCTLTDLFDMTDDIYFIVHIVNIISRLMKNHVSRSIFGYRLWKDGEICYIDTGHTILEIRT